MRTKNALAPLVASAAPDTMGLEEAANYLRLGRDATRDLWESGQLPGVSLNQKHLVFRRPALDAFLANMEQMQTRARLLASNKPAAANDGHTPTESRRRRTKRVDLAAYEAAADSTQEEKNGH